MGAFQIGALSSNDVRRMAAIGGDEIHGMESFWLEMLDRQAEGKLVVVVARDDTGPLGYAFLKWQSQYPPFADAGRPEISDLRVARPARRQGVATAIIVRCEQLAAHAGHTSIGIGFGLYAGYGAAQRLYVRLGYVPDGNGLTANCAPVEAGTTVRVDDDLVLWLVKELMVAATR